MRGTLLSWLPEDLDGLRILDAGCGTGALAVEAARRGARVLAIDLSPALVDVARRRIAALPDAALLLERIELRSGDMLDPALGGFDHVVAMDSLIHYEAADAVRCLGALAPRTGGTMVFTFAPSSPALALMHSVGKLFPRADRAPSIRPVAEARLRAHVAGLVDLEGWRIARSARVASGFYTSQAVELERA
jgi:magnesium-protoporphyrin O-methyltransferase